MITKLDMLKQVIVTSADYRKLAAVKIANPKIITSALFGTVALRFPKQLYVSQLEGQTSPNPFEILDECIKDAPNSNEEFFDFLLNHGVIFKAIGVSFLDVDFPTFVRNEKLLKIFRRNYGISFSSGVSTLYEREKTESQNMMDEETLKRLLANRKSTLQRIYTDDVPRARRLLCR